MSWDDALVSTEVSQPILRSLDVVREFLFSAKRRRHKDEAREILTLSYVRLILAWCYAQSKDQETAAGLIDRAKEVLGSDDPIHRTLVGAFEKRIAEGPGAPIWTRLSVDTSELGRFELYKVERMLGTCAILCRVEDRNAVRGYQTDRWIEETLVSKVLSADGSESDVRRLFQEIEASALSGAALVPLIGPCRRAGLESHLIDLLRAHLLTADREYERISVEVALAVLGAAPLPPLPLILASVARSERDERRVKDRSVARRLVAGYALCGRMEEASELAADAWIGCTDSFGSNSHFCLSVLGLAETIALSVVRHELALGKAP